METLSTPYQPSLWPFLSKTNDERHLIVAITTFDMVTMRRLLPKVGVNTIILGSSPMDYALRAKNYKAVFYIVKSGVILPKGATILHIAVTLNNISLVHLCLRKGYDPNALDHEGHTPFTRSFIRLNSVIITRLLKYGANVNTLDHEGCTILHHFSEFHSGYEVFLHTIFLYRPDYTIRNKVGETPLDVYKRMGYSKILILMDMFMYLERGPI